MEGVTPRRCRERSAVEVAREAEIKWLKQKSGDVVMDIDILKEAVRPYMPNPSQRQMPDE